MAETEKFYGVKLTDATGKIYYTEVDVKQGLTHNINIQTHKPISSKYPHSIIIGKNNYWSGTLSGAFENNEDGECIHDYSWGDADFRIGFVEWLHNGLTKMMYLSNSFILPITVLGEINVEVDHTIDDPVSNASFSWHQCGDRIYEAEQLVCPNCNQQIVPSTKYCPNCGNPVNEKVVDNG